MAMKMTIQRGAEASGVLLKDVFDDFIAEKNARNLEEVSITGYRNSFKKFKKFINDEYSDCETLKCSAVKISVIHNWIVSMKDEGIKITTINHHLRNARAFLYWCMNEERNYIKPSFGVELLRGQEETLKTFTESEQLALLEKPHRKAKFPEWRTWAIVNWVLDNGNRASTICNIKIQDIDFSNRGVLLNRTKNKKPQIIPISSTLEKVLKEYIKIWRWNAKQEDYLFPNVGNEQLTRNALRISFARYCKDRGVEKTSIHGLRHSFAKGWIVNNGNSLKLQKMLGHSTLDMTRKYVNLFNEDLKEDFDNHSPLSNLKKGTSRTQTVKRAV